MPKTMDPLSKEDLITAVHDQAKGEGVPSRAATSRIVNCVLDKIISSLASGHEVAIPGLGKFKVKQRAARKARNPQNGETISIPARKAITFRAAAGLKNAVN